MLFFIISSLMGLACYLTYRAFRDLSDQLPAPLESWVFWDLWEHDGVIGGENPRSALFERRFAEIAGRPISSAIPEQPRAKCVPPNNRLPFDEEEFNNHLSTIYFDDLDDPMLMF